MLRRDMDVKEPPSLSGDAVKLRALACTEMRRGCNLARPADGPGYRRSRQPHGQQRQHQRPDRRVDP